MKNFIKTILLLTFLNLEIYAMKNDSNSNNFINRIRENNTWKKITQDLNPFAKESSKTKKAAYIGLGLLLMNRLYIDRKLSCVNSFVQNLSHKTLYTPINKIHTLFKINNFDNLTGNFAKKLVAIPDGFLRKMWPNNKNSIIFNSVLLSLFLLRGELFKSSNNDDSSNNKYKELET